MRWALAAGVLLAALMATGLAGAAAGAPAALQLRYVPEPALESTAGRIAVSPTGRSIYLLGGIDNRTTLRVLAREPGSGKLSRPAGRATCFRPWYVRSQICSSAPGLNNSKALAVSRDGRDVAIGAYPTAQLALLRSDGAAGLRFRSCLGKSVDGFRCGPVRGLTGAEDLAFSPDGRNLYVAARQDDPGLLALARDPATGALRQLRGASGCLQREGRVQPERPPCAVVPADWYAPRLVRVTSDGRTVVTDSRTANEGSGIFVFRRDAATGALTPLACYVDSGKPPCEPYPAARGVSDLVVARDSRALIVATGEPGVLSVLALDRATGALTLEHCLASVATPGCNRAPVPFFATLALTPDGSRLFASDVDVIRSYTFAAANRRLAPVAGRGACVTVERANCTRLPERLRFSFGAVLAVSPDGRWLYGNAVAFRVIG